MNPKFSIVFSVCGFVLSFLVALISGVPFTFVIVRALLVGAVFFVMSVLIHLVVDHFLPELTHVSDSAGIDDSHGQDVSEESQYMDTDAPQSGGLVDVTVDDAGAVYTNQSFGTDDIRASAPAASSNAMQAVESNEVFTETSADGLGSLPDLDTFSVGSKENHVAGKQEMTKNGDGTSATEASSMARAIQTMLAHDN